MALDDPKEHINDRVRGTIFNDAENSDLHTVRTRSTGSFTPTGLRIGLLTTCMDVSTTAVKLPATPLTSRNSMSIYNLSETDILYIGNSDVTADRTNGNTAGWEIPPEGMFNVDLSDQIEIYGRIASGTIQVKIIEYA
jgi:hypothetical protein